MNALDREVPNSNRNQNRGKGLEVAPFGTFVNEPDTDPSIAANRVWANRILERSRDSDLGTATIDDREDFGCRSARIAHRLGHRCRPLMGLAACCRARAHPA